MKRTLPCVALAVAVLSLAACDRKANGGAGDSTATQPAGTQPAPTAQHQAAPQTGAAPSPNYTPEPPVTSRDTVHHLGAGQTYASCMARAARAGEAERQIMQSSCAQLPDAPKK